MLHQGFETAAGDDEKPDISGDTNPIITPSDQQSAEVGNPRRPANISGDLNSCTEPFQQQLWIPGSSGSRWTACRYYWVPLSAVSGQHRAEADRFCPACNVLLQLWWNWWFSTTAEWWSQLCSICTLSGPLCLPSHLPSKSGFFSLSISRLWRFQAMNDI